MTSSFAIKADHPSLPGHFPGNPIVPGVVVLEHIVAALRRSRPDLACTGVRRMKFLRPLAAEETVTVSFGEPRDGMVAVQARVGDSPLADGRLALAPAKPEAAARG
jgi:3-hydroxyacyl-[acyl-carrier-protein] dehydratase